MALAFTCAAREPLTGEVGENSIDARVAVDRRSRGLPVDRLVRNRADIACVVAVGPLENSLSITRKEWNICAYHSVQ